MIKIIVEIHPFGDASKARTVASMDLWNDGSGHGSVGNYEAHSIIEPSPWNPNQEKRGGKVIDHPRMQPIWTLVFKMLSQMGYGESSIGRRLK